MRINATDRITAQSVEDRTHAGHDFLCDLLVMIHEVIPQKFSMIYICQCYA
jgi:hypothetical protein